MSDIYSIEPLLCKKCEEPLEIDLDEDTNNQFESNSCVNEECPESEDYEEPDE